MNGPATPLALGLLPVLLLAGCAAPATNSRALPAEGTVRALRTASVPVIDGRSGDEAWARSVETVVPLEGEKGPTSCTVRALVTDGTLFLLLRWPDATEDRVHKPWVRGADGTWTAGTEREDVASVAFPMDGPFTADMLRPVECTWDVWHWKAGRTDPAGHAMDRIHRHSFTDPGGKRASFPMTDGRTLFIARPEDAGTGATGDLPAPAEGERGPRYVARSPEGSAGDVAARGTWSGGWWTLELARALDTGNPDDAAFEAGTAVPFAIAIMDRAEDEDHCVSKVLRLVLPGSDARVR